MTKIAVLSTSERMPGPPNPLMPNPTFNQPPGKLRLPFPSTHRVPVAGYFEC
jgi:hypothetical protein